MFSPDDVFNHHKYLKDHPEEIKHKSIYDKDFKELYKELERLKEKGVVVKEKNPDQNMLHRHDKR